MKLQKKL